MVLSICFSSKVNIKVEYHANENTFENYEKKLHFFLAFYIKNTNF